MKYGKLVGKVYRVEAGQRNSCTDCDVYPTIDECKYQDLCKKDHLRIIPATDDIEKLLAEALERWVELHTADNGHTPSYVTEALAKYNQQREEV